MTEPLDLDAIKARADAATPGPWTTPGSDSIGQWAIYDREWTVASAAAYSHNNVLSAEPGARAPGYIDSDANAEFIAHAREDVPALVQLAKDQASRITELEAERDSFKRQADHFALQGNIAGAERDGYAAVIERAKFTLERSGERYYLERIYATRNVLARADTSAVVQAIRDKAVADARAAEPTGEQIEAAAREMFEDPLATGDYTWAEMVAEDPSRADLWRADARRVLTAAIRSQQGGGSNGG